MHDVVRLLTGSASDWLEDYFEHEAVKGYHASSSIIGSKVGPMSPGSGLVLLFHKMGEHDGHLGSWAFHKGGNGGFTQVLARAAEALGAEIRLECAGERGAHRGGPRGRRRAGGRHRVPRAGGGLGARPAAHLPRPRRPARAARRPGRQRRADEVPRASRRRSTSPSTALPVFPALPDTVDHYGGFLNIGPTIEYVERAFDAAKYGWYSERPFIDAAIQSVVDPDMAPPGKHVHVVLRAVRAVRAARQRLGDRAGALRRHRAGGARVALPRLRRPGAAPRGRHPGRHRAGHRAHRGQHLRRASSSPRRCTSSARRPAGASTAPRSTATTSAAPAPTRAAASSARRASWRASGCCATSSGSTSVELVETTRSRVVEQQDHVRKPNRHLAHTPVEPVETKVTRRPTSVEPVETPAPSVEPVETPPSVEPVETPAVEPVETTPVSRTDTWPIRRLSLSKPDADLALIHKRRLSLSIVAVPEPIFGPSGSPLDRLRPNRG